MRGGGHIVGGVPRVGARPSALVIDVLIVEDNPGDVLLISKGLARVPGEKQLHVVHDGAAAISFVERSGSYSEAPRPALIMLDLNLPRKDGRAVLARLKSDPKLRQIPVVVLSTSSSPDDIARAYADHANSYVVKPIDARGFIEAVRGIGEYWLGTVKLPVN